MSAVAQCPLLNGRYYRNGATEIRRGTEIYIISVIKFRKSWLKQHLVGGHWVYGWYFQVQWWCLILNAVTPNSVLLLSIFKVEADKTVEPSTFNNSIVLRIYRVVPHSDCFALWDSKISLSQQMGSKVMKEVV